MVIKFKDTIKGKRIVLKRNTPNLELAKFMFETINQNRKHLNPWFTWPELTLKIEDSLKYLFDKEKETKKGDKIEYGIYINNEYVGNISLFDISERKKSAEIGYWLSTNFTKKGYMTEALKLLEKEVFENLKLNRIQLRCDEKNNASVGVAKKCGYKYEGKLRDGTFSKYFNNFRNLLIYSKLKSEYKKK